MGRECFISFMVSIAEPCVMLTVARGTLVVPRVPARSPGFCLYRFAPRCAPESCKPLFTTRNLPSCSGLSGGGAGRLVLPSPTPSWALRERSLLIFHDILNHRTYLPTLPASTKITATIIMIIKRVLYLLHLKGGMGGGEFATPLDCRT